MNKASEIIGVTDDNSSQGQGQEQKEVKLVDIPVADENVALNLMVSFLSWIP